MSSKRPFVKGEVINGKMDRAQVLQDDVDLEIPDGSTVLGTNAGDHLERVRIPAQESGLPPTVLTADMEFTGNDYVRSGADTSWLELPSTRVQYPRLTRYGLVEFIYTGLYFNNTIVTPGGQFFDFELMVDGVATGKVASWNFSATSGFPSTIIFEAKLRFIGSINSPTTHDLEQRLRIQGGNPATDYTEVLNLSQATNPTIDSTAARLLSFRFRRRVGEANEAVLWRSFLAHQPLYRSGL